MFKLKKYKNIYSQIYIIISFISIFYNLFKDRKQGEFSGSNETKLFWKLNSKTAVLKGCNPLKQHPTDCEEIKEGFIYKIE
jgi:hypothetical protein